MKIALVHYHLKTGGVTTVLKSQLDAIRGNGDVIVLTGDRASGDWSCKVVEIPGLGYTRPGRAPPDANQVAEQVLKTLSAVWPGGCDILHVHNPTLAKNRQFLQIIKRLQRAGVNLFLQIHDFAEDGRPDAYFQEDYPEDCHYGVINARDAGILQTAGLVDAGLHCLPNTVTGRLVPECSVLQPWILYPVRAIRRKNLGEAFLLSLFFKTGQRLAVTQPPNSPVDWTSYRDWRHWVSANRLPVDFEVGEKTAFPLLIGAAEAVLTTSIAEGFGLVFLEPWISGKVLWGRRLEGICTDLEAHGIRLDALYKRIDVPLDWIDARDFSRAWHAAVWRAAACYGHSFADGVAQRAYIRITRDKTVDFGMLSEKFQRQVLDRLINDPLAKSCLRALNPWLSCPGAVADPAAMVANNHKAVMRHYGPGDYRKRLLKIYDQVRSHPVRQRIDKAVLRETFFDLDLFPLLKWGAYDH